MCAKCTARTDDGCGLVISHRAIWALISLSWTGIDGINSTWYGKSKMGTYTYVGCYYF